MPRSFLSRVWKAVKPPPPLPTRRRLNRAQRRLIRGTSIAVALGASTWAVYAYIASAPDRARSNFSKGQFTRAIEIDPTFAEAYRARADTSQAAGQTEAALADLEKAIAIDPSDWLAYISRGTIERSQGNSQKALTDFTQAIHLHPTSKAYYQRGLTYQALDQPRRAVDDYSLAVSYDPGAPYIYRARAKAKRDGDDIAGAQQDQETAERLEKKQ
jgi:tetratricopeptide (TPR) repeat protein